MSAAKQRDRIVLQPDQMVDHFRIRKQLGTGGFGDIYSVCDTSNENPNNLYALKIEHFDEDNLENIIMYELLDDIHFPNIVAEGKFDDYYHYIVMTLFGPSLGLMRRMVNKSHFSPITATKLAIDTLNCIEAFHEKGFVHTDIKPANFLIQSSSESPIVLIDFGLSYRYIDEKSGKHIKMRKDADFTGTAKYASLNSHYGLTLSRRDDLISWIYSIIELAEGQLPWGRDEDVLDAFKKKKKANLEKLCYSLPPEFKKVINYIKKLQFEEKPNYAGIRTTLREALNRLNGSISKYDWENLDNDTIRTISEVPINIPQSKRGDEEDEEVKLVDGGCSSCLLV